MTKNIVINSIITFMILSMGYIIVTHQNMYNNVSIAFIIVSLFIYLYGVITYNKNICVFAYLLSIITIILIRGKIDKIINDDFYLIDWLKLILKNRIVFINVIGNLILYIPLYILMNNNKVFSLLILIILLELLQYILELGVFDIIDILLNFIGVIIISIIYRMKIWTQRTKKI